MARYTSPRRINLVSLTLFLAVAAGVYAIVKFGPSYYRQFEIREVLENYAVRYVARASGLGLSSSEQEDRLSDEAEDELRERGVPDPGVRVRFEVSAGQVTARAEYSETIEHPLIDKVTVLHFSPSVTKPLRRQDPW